LYKKSIGKFFLYIDHYDLSSIFWLFFQILPFYRFVLSLNKKLLLIKYKGFWNAYK